MAEWPTAASNQAQAVLQRHAWELWEEAERVAHRNEATHVAPAYVDVAATTLRLRPRSSAVADVLLAIGPALAGLAGGVGVTVVTSEAAIDLEGWVTAGSYATGALGLVMLGAGAALKLRR